MWTISTNQISGKPSCVRFIPSDSLCGCKCVCTMCSKAQDKHA